MRKYSCVKFVCLFVSEQSTVVANSENGDSSPLPGSGGGPHLVNKQMVLPFIPPKFPSNNADSNSLIKPSEYLRSINGSKLQRSTSDLNIAIIEEIKVPAVTLEKFEEETIAIGPTVVGPPPPPLPVPQTNQQQQHETNTATRKQQQPLSTISIHDLSSVQLKKTLATKTMSAPPIRSTGKS